MGSTHGPRVSTMLPWHYRRIMGRVFSIKRASTIFASDTYTNVKGTCVYLAVGYFSLIAVVPRVYSRPFMPYNIRSRIIRVICVFIERRIITTPPLRILDRTVKAVKRYLKYCRIDFNISCLRLFTIFFLFFFFFKLRTRLDTRAYYI